jgi:AMP-binding enzyme
MRRPEDAAMAMRLPLRDILAAAARRPHAEAMRHKRHGAWVSWSWSDLATQVEQASGTLQGRHPNATLVAVSGAYSPSLLAFALAAARIGAAVVPLPASPPRAALAEFLNGARPDVVFLGSRDQVGTWRAALHEAGQAPEIVADLHLPWGRATAEGVTSIAALLGSPPRMPRRPATGDVVWIEEGTDWAEGLCYVLHVAAQSGHALAFPESHAAAARDRQETQPAGFALSAAHHARLRGDLAARLPAGGGPAAKLTRLALDAVRTGRATWPHQWVLGRLRRPLGLARLRDLTVVSASGRPAEMDDDLFVALGIRAGHALPPITVEPVGQAGLAFA